MKIGVPKEIKSHEYRVGLTPAAVREYVTRNHAVYVESGAGLGIGAQDADYTAAGASVLATAAEVFKAGQLIIKVKEPLATEIPLIEARHILFTYLHLAPDPLQARGLLASGCTAVAYETVRETDGSLPLLAPMSEVAGRLAVTVAGQLLMRHAGGRGLLLGGVPGVPAARILVLGAGVAGAQAVRMAVGAGAQVTVINRSLPKLREIDAMFRGQVRTRPSMRSVIEEEVAGADVVIGAVLVPGASAPRLVTRAMLSAMGRGSVLIDIAIDQGGCFETSRPTTHAEPTYEVNGIVHYCVANMPGAVPRTSCHALNHATLEFGLMLAGQGLNALREDPRLRAGLNVHAGHITHAEVAHSLGMVHTPALQALGDGP